MRTLIDQIEIAANSRHYFLALFAAIAFPDIAGASRSPDVALTGRRYSAIRSKLCIVRATSS